MKAFMIQLSALRGPAVENHIGYIGLEEGVIPGGMIKVGDVVLNIAGHRWEVDSPMDEAYDADNPPTVRLILAVVTPEVMQEHQRWMAQMQARAAANPGLVMATDMDLSHIGFKSNGRG